MTKTKVGKELQKIRIDHDLNRAKMAKAIGMSESELAAVESGKTAMSGNAINQVISKYFGDDNKAFMAAALNEAARDSVSLISFDMVKLNEEQRDMVFNLKIQIDLANPPIKRGRKARVKKSYTPVSDTSVSDTPLTSGDELYL
ncbi:MAG: helix-turn-helix transcriptional regulator [Methylomicrobium sp.]|nr:helix-turn-helix transcriptional regulator [Methylomicrobium sp.]